MREKYISSDMTMMADISEGDLLRLSKKIKKRLSQQQED
jgi:hypothetical protein